MLDTASGIMSRSTAVAQLSLARVPISLENPQQETKDTDSEPSYDKIESKTVVKPEMGPSRVSTFIPQFPKLNRRPTVFTQSPVVRRDEMAGKYGIDI